ncbi:hypothetical protein [Massilia sp. TN1-12]|uniref:hypothetical protein n=1 Tax=Massilia paldalensis TaxID=3377675 RepID=UPI00384B8A03
MNAFRSPTEPSAAAQPAPRGALGGLLHAIGKRLRRGLALAGAAYVDGHTPSV